jgi:hypothetical protein
MPITTCGKNRYKWGKNGACGSKKEAQAQAAAAYASGYGKKSPQKKSKANEAKQILIDIIREELEAYVREQRDGK